MKLTTQKKKADMLEAIIFLWKDTEKELQTFPDNKYLQGRYTAMIDLLKMIPIYEKEGK